MAVLCSNAYIEASLLFAVILLNPSTFQKLSQGSNLFFVLRFFPVAPFSKHGSYIVHRVSSGRVAGSDGGGRTEDVFHKDGNDRMSTSPGACKWPSEGDWTRAMPRMSLKMLL